MRRRAFLYGSVAILVAPLGIEAQQAGKVHRIGYLTSGSATASASRHFVEAFRQGLAELGWIDGQNVAIVYRFAEGRHDRLPELAAELVRSKVDVIVAGPTLPVQAAKSATATIPIVMTPVGDPVRLGLVASLARPGGNVTGVSFDVAFETVPKALELLRESVPKIRRVAVLSNADSPGQAVALSDLTPAAQSLGLQLRSLKVRGPDGFDAAFAAVARDPVDALFVLPEPLFIVHRTRLANLAAQYRLPSMYAVKENVEAGGFMSYGPSLVAAFRRAAVFVDKIFKGAKPADLPVEQPTKFELVINLKTARALGLTIPPSLLARADQVIE
jgi:putative ABC transport system substrate-binding protein